MALALLTPLAAAQPRISFVRRIPPRYDLSPANEIAVVYVIGENDSVGTFVGELVDRTNAAGPIHLIDVTAHGTYRGSRPETRSIRRFRRRYPADRYMGIGRFTCMTTTRSGEGSTTDYEGARVRRKHEFIDATCRARVEVLDGRTGVETHAFEVSGEGTSPRVERAGEEERKIAMDSAARYAAIVAAEMITPREIRESVELDPAAPYFERGMALIDAGRLRAARDFWETMLVQAPRSAPLFLKLAAVTEAGGDPGAACDYLERAMMAAPKDRRYRIAMEAFRRRNR
jgi:hypothetical protein